MDKLVSRAFQALKDYLLSPPVLVPPTSGKPLLLYISTTNSSLGALLVQHDDQGKEWAIYYISKALVGYELNYTPIERACLAMIFASQKLKHSMLIHKVKLIASIDPLKYLLRKVALTWRLAKWVMVLNESGIEYVN